MLLFYHHNESLVEHEERVGASFSHNKTQREHGGAHVHVNKFMFKLMGAKRSFSSAAFVSN